jgi:branched-chain amino acid aminotransferase
MGLRRAEISRLPKVDFKNLPFGTVFSDHMLVAEYKNGRWGEPRIQPYGPLPLLPSVIALQYGVSVFEGMKAHKSARGDLLLFRPRENARRLNRSAARLAMPEVPESLFLDGLRELVRLDRGWVPDPSLGSLYIRPCYFAVEESLKVKASEEYLFVILTGPTGPYFTAPVSALVTSRYVRAFPGGTGDIKPAGNYAPSLVADQLAREQGCHTTLWLDAREGRYVEECGVMNVFFVLGDEVATPELGGTILPGVTRDSVITLLRDAQMKVSERRVGIDEVFAAYEQGNLRECFGTGTGATIAHVGKIRQGDREALLCPPEERKIGNALLERLRAIVTGNGPDPHGWVEKI